MNRLTILSLHHITNGRKYYLCQCECGNNTVVSEHHLKTGHTKSCGCLKKERLKQNREHYKRTGPNAKHLINVIHLGEISGERIRKCQLNGKGYPNNTSGAIGVSYDKCTKCWQARLQYRNKSYRIRCSSFEEAVRARKQLEKELGIYTEEGIKAKEE